MGKRMSLMSFLTGLLSASVGIGWIVFFYYFGVGAAL
jgi:hypothetical protein